MRIPRPLIPVIALLSVLVLASCGGGGTLEQHPALEISAITVLGSFDGPGTVTVAGVADQDGDTGTGFQVRFTLDGGADAASLPRDPGVGGARSYDLPVVASNSVGTTTVPLLVEILP